MSLEQLEHWKNFLADRPEWAFLAISLMVNSVLFTLLMRAMNARLRDAQRWLPVAERLSNMVTVAATKARKKRELAQSPLTTNTEGE